MDNKKLIQDEMKKHAAEVAEAREKAPNFKNLKALLNHYYTDKAAYFAAYEYDKLKTILDDFYNYFKLRDGDFKDLTKIGRAEAVEYYCYLLEKFQNREEVIKKHVAELSSFFVFAKGEGYMPNLNWPGKDS